MPRPRLDRREQGLTTTGAAKTLGCSPSNVRRLQSVGMLPRKKDGSGVYRFHAHDLVEAARKLGRVVHTDGERVAKVYAYFVVPGFRLTRKELGRIVVETHEHPDEVVALWTKYQASGEPDEGALEIERLSREYDEKIAAQDKELARKRRATFIRGDEDKDDAEDDEPPKSRRTG